MLKRATGSPSRPRRQPSATRPKLWPADQKRRDAGRRSPKPTAVASYASRRDGTVSALTSAPCKPAWSVPPAAPSTSRSPMLRAEAVPALAPGTDRLAPPPAHATLLARSHAPGVLPLAWRRSGGRFASPAAAPIGFPHGAPANTTRTLAARAGLLRVTLPSVVRAGHVRTLPFLDRRNVDAPKRCGGRLPLDSLGSSPSRGGRQRKRPRGPQWSDTPS